MGVRFTFVRPFAEWGDTSSSIRVRHCSDRIVLGCFVSLRYDTMVDGGVESIFNFWSFLLRSRAFGLFLS